MARRKVYNTGIMVKHDRVFVIVHLKNYEGAFAHTVSFSNEQAAYEMVKSIADKKYVNGKHWREIKNRDGWKHPTNKEFKPLYVA